MIGLLAKIPSFRKALIKHQFIAKTKAKGLEGLEYIFSDSEGNKYYTWLHDKDLPITRKTYLEQKLIEMQSGFTAKEMRQFINTLDKAINRRNEKGWNPDLAMVGWLKNEMENRLNWIVREDIMLEILACMYVRSGENIYVIDEDLIQEKVRQFRIDMQLGGYADFFLQGTLSRSIPFLQQYKGNLQSYLMSIRTKKKAAEEMMKIYSSGKELSVT